MENWEKELKGFEMDTDLGLVYHPSVKSFIKEVREQAKEEGYKEGYDSGQKSRDQEVWEANSKIQ